MNSKKHKQWTILVTSDANKRVYQLKIPKISVGIVGVIFAALSISLIFSQMMVKETRQENKLIASELVEADQEIESKDDNIAYYKAEARTLNRQVTRLQELEQELATMIASLNPKHINASTGAGPTGGLEILSSDNSSEEIIQSPVSESISKTETLNERYRRLGGSVPTLINSYQDSIENFSELNKTLDATPTYWPADAERITSRFGNRSDPFTTRGAMHTGIDIAGSYGTDVYATADGKVTGAGREGGYGNSVVIKHTSTLKTRYAHLSKINVEMGEEVKKGDVIGLMGSSGRSTGVHLHYEIIHNNVPINPYKYMTFMDRFLN
ncbi:M23 family metallopeptidase [Virgibacillus sp. DJP39]|uniref:M23 family metallopeptidase n=1 Tax=Virgibacillus sp. DJP39 TaxID=3409790 RepID=UPI003BB78851